MIRRCLHSPEEVRYANERQRHATELSDNQKLYLGELVAVKRTIALFLGVINRPNKQANSVPILHGTRVRKRALANQTVTSHRPVTCT